MSFIVLSQTQEGVFEGGQGNLEVLVRQRGHKWSYTLLERNPRGGLGYHGTASELKEVLEKISQHLERNSRVWILLEN